MHRQSSHTVLHSVHSQQTLLHPDIPHLDSAIRCARHELSLTTALKMYIDDGGGIFVPLLDDMAT